MSVVRRGGRRLLISTVWSGGPFYEDAGYFGDEYDLRCWIDNASETVSRAVVYD
jgi:hypothetical protein